MLLLSLFLLACSSPDCPDCPKTECPPCDESSASLADWESAVLADYLQEIREGIQLHGEKGFGICQGGRQCDTFIGTSADTLPAGDYYLHSEFSVPSLGQPWKVNFVVDCTIDDGKGNTSSQHHEKEYDVKYAGKDRGYRLSPLWKIQSPHPNGARECEFSLTPIRPDGQAGEAWTGSYKTPAP